MIAEVLSDAVGGQREASAAHRLARAAREAATHDEAVEAVRRVLEDLLA
jgi:hypothetical protein